MQTQVENRGTEEVPFGYVYVGDTRLGFAGCKNKHCHIFQSNWGTPSTVEGVAAVKALLGAFEGYTISLGDLRECESK